MAYKIIVMWTKKGVWRRQFKSTGHNGKCTVSIEAARAKAEDRA